MLLDRVSALTLADDTKSFAELRQLYESEDGLRVPKQVFNAMRRVHEPIAS